MSTSELEVKVQRFSENEDRINKFTNGSDTETVTASTGQVFPTMAKTVSDFLKANAMEPFANTATLLASIPTNPKWLAWAADTGKFWYWEGSWVDTGLSQKEQALNEIVIQKSKNLFNLETAFQGRRIAGQGTLGVAADSIASSAIPVIAGETYTISWSNTVPTYGPWWSVFKDEQLTQLAGYSTSATSLNSPVTITIPPEGAFLIVNAKHGTDYPMRENFQIELGSVQTAYEPYELKSTLKEDLTQDLVKLDSLETTLEPFVTKPYELVEKSANLFDESKVQDNKYLANTGEFVNSAPGWKCSGYIPITPGETYTLSFKQKPRIGISFFTADNITSGIASSYSNSPASPLTLVAPANAAFCVFNLVQSTSQIYEEVQFEKGSIATAYKPYGETQTLIDPSYIKQNSSTVAGPDTKLTLSSGTGSLNFKDKVKDLTLGLKIFNPVTYTGSAAFNFNNDDLNGLRIRTNGDDIAPVRMMSATIGANHGYSVTTLTSNAHGKTALDVGSVWSDGTFQWVITRIVNANSFDVTCRTENRSYSSTLPMLVHVSGATNTTSVTPTAFSAKQWYPMLKNHKLNAYVDNELISGNGNFTVKGSLDISESYDLMEKSDIVEWLISNGKKEVTNYLAASALNVSMIYSFDAKGLACTIPSQFIVLKNLSASMDLMFTQSARLDLGNGPVRYYVPRSKSFLHESNPYDFSQPTVVDNLVISTRINFTSDKTIEGKVLPDRLVMLNDKIGYAVGYLPVLDAAPEKRNLLTSKGIQISNTSSKVYPYLVDNLEATPLQRGASFKAIAYRVYFDLHPNRTAFYYLKSSEGIFVFLDWHDKTDFIDQVDLPYELQGKTIEIVYSSDGVELLSGVTTSNLFVKVNALSAELVLRLK